MIVIGFVAAMFVIPPRCGAYSYVTFFAIVWLAATAFFVSKLRRATPRPTWLPLFLVGLLCALFAYPVVIGWFFLRFDGGGVLALLAGAVLYLIVVATYRKIFLPSLFGPKRPNIIDEHRLVRVAQAEARAQRAQYHEMLIDAAGQTLPNSTDE